MLRDRYAPLNLVDLGSALRLALDPVLTHLDRVRDDDALFQAVVEERMRTAYQRLLTLTTTMVKQAERVGSALIDQGIPLGRRFATALHRSVPLVQQVKPQTTRRIFQGETVPAPAKVVSLFEPHTALIRQGKPGRPTECGRVLWLDEGEGGIISRYAMWEGNPAEDAPLPPSLDQHRRVFRRPPRLLAGDRGMPPPRTNGRPPRTASRRWCCPSQVPSRPNG
jgi:transposase, IS5 family